MAQDDLSPELGDTVRALRYERGPCPSESALVEYQALVSPDRRRHPVDAHVQICSRCQLVLLHLGEAEAHSRLFRWQWAAAAALVLVFVVPVIYQRMAGDVPSETIRGTDLQPVAPIGRVTAVSAFEWQSPIQAARYRVRVFRDGTEIWSATSDVTRLSVTDSVPLERGAEYTWLVEALDASGDVRLVSPGHSFTLN